MAELFQEGSFRPMHDIMHNTFLQNPPIIQSYEV